MGKLHENNFHSDQQELVQYMLAKGSTFQQICLDMDISDSQGFQRHQNLAKIYLQCVHYVAEGRITSLKGLQIITLNPHLINVNADVKEHIAYMQKGKKLKLCSIPTYIMPPGLKCVFLNTSSLHKHIAMVKANFNICAADVFFLAETKLIKMTVQVNISFLVFKNNTEMIKHHMIHLDHHIE